ncbi:ANTH-domain-containing protein [Multifurca ochricompacta]|uniref:ANTH-domain-containing protein n=1 Tax=Multifurca ochricompacta TaxID=376703 RepID=A0AAD4MDI0_9AGAM|nr:ANTH-domain-containing protein [Multifurca ochricompacta]
MSYGRRPGAGFDIDGDEVHYPTRPVDKEKAEQELAVNIKKATSADETAPKQKHVRKCIVYTWDYHSSISFWSGLRVQPILSDEVQAFKALIMVHKVLQEGHPVTIKEAQSQTGWLETCSRTTGNEGGKGYGPLIRAYVQFLLAKLRFHRLRPEFNGLFEYEEYVTLKGIDDPNEGYETISDLMQLQDQIESFQKMVFSHFRLSANNECRISSLVPLVKESWGIYRFITSMLRAMYRRTNDIEALEPLRQRYNAQHYGLRKFYYECSNLKYLTGLINVPKLGQEPPNLFDNEGAPDLPARPTTTKPPTPPPAALAADDAAISEQARLLKQYEDQQAALRAQQEAEEHRRQELELQQQMEFEQRQREQQERERLALEQLQQQQLYQLNNQAAQRVNELERDLLVARGQFERDQLLLEQYDRRVKALEGELGSITANINSQMASKDELIKQLQDQVTLWRNKYEALAKLYSQLRTEHLDMLSKSKQLQLKANSAHEAIDRMERIERDLKAKNLELADMIRERDRARFDVDRQKASHREEIERSVARLTSLVKGPRTQPDPRVPRQITELEDSLRSKQIQLDDLLAKLDGAAGELERLRDEKDQEIAILQEGMDHTLQQLSESQQNQGLADEATNAQIDTLILDNRKKLNQIIDSILQACQNKIDEAIYELESPMQAGNQSSTPEATGGDHVDVIKGANDFAQAIADTLRSVKGITRLVNDDDASDKLIGIAKSAGDVGYRFFLNLQSYKLELVDRSQRTSVAMRNNGEVRNALTKLSESVEAIIPKGKSLTKANGDIGDLVEQEMLGAAKAIDAAMQRLQQLMARPHDSGRFSAVDLQVHDSILAAALAITNAIARLIKAATESQQEIVSQGKGASSTQQFYKRNNRWTDVAFATNLLIETADGVLSGTHSLEQLIVASNEVAGATAQLVAASRVKANLMSKTQERLELAAKAVTEACKALVKMVRAISARQVEEEDVDYKNMAALEFKKREMEQQVEILRLEKELGASRHRLGAMRRAGYHTDETD